MSNDDFDVVKKGETHRPSFKDGFIAGIKYMCNSISDSLQEPYKDAEYIFEEHYEN